MNNYFTLFYFINHFSSNNIKNSEKNNFDIDFDVFNDVFTILDKLKFEPHQNTINNIMNFSKSYDVIKLKSLKHVELNLN